ncbi:MAG TPA: hypothetical protein VMF06_17380 [Candidatus Limnocylindria bacterium]|nr:hypothetical protein [Candidatus Limnocylindria bacterium]
MKIPLPVGLWSAVFGAALATQAATVVFTFGVDDNGTTSNTYTSGGVTLTFSDADSGSFVSDSDGLWMAKSGGPVPSSWNLSFDTAVSVVSYEIGYATDAAAGTFTLSTSGSTSTGNTLAPAGTYSINGAFSIPANQSGTLTSFVSLDGEWAQLKTLTVTTVPEAGSSVLAAGSLCLVAWVGLRSGARKRRGS